MIAHPRSAQVLAFSPVACDIEPRIPVLSDQESRALAGGVRFVPASIIGGKMRRAIGVQRVEARRARASASTGAVTHPRAAPPVSEARRRRAALRRAEARPHRP